MHPQPKARKSGEIEALDKVIRGFFLAIPSSLVDECSSRGQPKGTSCIGQTLSCLSDLLRRPFYLDCSCFYSLDYPQFTHKLLCLYRYISLHLNASYLTTDHPAMAPAAEENQTPLKRARVCWIAVFTIHVSSLSLTSIARLRRTNLTMIHRRKPASLNPPIYRRQTRA